MSGKKVSNLSPYSHNQYDPESTNTTWYKMVHMVPEGSSVLDIGCSTGELGKVLKKERRATVVGIDITAADVAVAQKVLDDAFVYDIENGALSDAPQLTKKYDVIIFADVIEHLKDPSTVLRKIKTLLNKDGRVIFSIPNMAHMYVRLQLLEGSFRYTETGLLDYTHLHFYDDQEVARIFTEAGYSVKGYDSTTFDYPDGLLKEKLAKVGLKLTKEFSRFAHQKQAIIFEYVGWAQPSDTKPKTQRGAATTSPVDDVLAYVQRVKDADASELKQVQEQLKATQKHADKLEAALVAEVEKVKLYEKHSPKAILRKITNRQSE